MPAAFNSLCDSLTYLQDVTMLQDAVSRCFDHLRNPRMRADAFDRAMKTLQEFFNGLVFCGLRAKIEHAAKYLNPLQNRGARICTSWYLPICVPQGCHGPHSNMS